MKNVEPVILIGNAGHTLTEYAEEIGADLIIVGSHRPEFKDYLLGATAARIVRHAPCSVHVLR
jgi:nucleotide-binding universal stress UspA family protein